ncbi:MAG: type ISP restriction/modification enzyme, partial [Dolichospermum sp.]
ENTARIKRQNDRTISVIIGNPPYNAKQENFNDNNANRSYQNIDKLIKESYVKYSTAQKTKVYDMYTRFIRWASDRLGKNGIIAFITNSSFIDARTFDGFRKTLADEFSEIYVIDLGGNIRAGDKSGNVFNIMLGVAISFMIKRDNYAKDKCKIFYANLSGINTSKQKLEFLVISKFSEIRFEHITPDKNFNWINQSDNDFDSLLPLVDKDVKAGKAEEAVFKLFSRGVATQRDEWVYDLSEESLVNKMKFFVEIYQSQFDKQPEAKLSQQIKWDEDLKSYFKRKIQKQFDKTSIQPSLYRPFCKQNLYFDKHFNGRTYQWFDILNEKDAENKYIAFSALGNTKPFHCLGSNTIIDLHLTGDSQCFSLYRYDKEGKRIDNITDWGLKQIQTHYQDETITKIDIFHYTYAVLHNPAYRTKYELNLKRDFPRLPYYENFRKWVNWGKQLMEIHINYETVTPYNLTRLDIPLK